MSSIILIAPPAGGKGTLSEMICKKYNIPHISTGDLMRAAALQDNERGRYIKNQMETGGLVSDEITYELLTERILKEDCSFGYVLDGFPRNVAQAEKYDQILEKLGKSIGHVIVLDIPKELAKARITGRRTCPSCTAIYNINTKESMPKVDDTCDTCNVSLISRADDNAETYEIRYQTYVDKTEPLINYYTNKGILVTVDGSKDKYQTMQQVIDVLGRD